MADTKSTIVIVLPGTTGTSLVQYENLMHGATIKPVWPGQVVEALAKKNYQHAENLLTQAGVQEDGGFKSTTLVPFRPAVGPLGLTGYVPLFTYLTGHLGAPGEPAIHITWNAAQQQVPVPVSGASGDLVIGFGYDWRQDNGWTATRFKPLIDAIKSSYAAAGRPYRIVLLAHSMGGLVSRAYLEGADFDTESGIEALITMGTPHLGAPMALDPITGGPLIPNLPDDVIDMMANSPDFPSTYELLPPPGLPTKAADGTTQAGGFVTDSATQAVVDIYADGASDDFSTILTTPTANGGFGASAVNLQTAKSFTQGLTGKPPAGVAYYAAYGLSNSIKIRNLKIVNTITSYVWTPASGTAGTITPVSTSYDTPGVDGVPANIWTGGDGIVPVWSAMFAGNSLVTSAAVQDCNHLEMPASTAMQTQIGKWLNAIRTGATEGVPLAA